MSTTVSVEEVKALKARLHEINALELSDITWTENGKPIEIKPSHIDDWRFIGLSNADFIASEFYAFGYTSPTLP